MIFIPPPAIIKRTGFIEILDCMTLFFALFLFRLEVIVLGRLEGRLEGLPEF